MRIVREQMICLISPDWSPNSMVWDANSKTILQSFRVSLEQLLTDVGVVRFAAIALLPPLYDAPADALPSLMLELAVDEGLRPADLLERLVYHPSQAFIKLYQCYRPHIANQKESTLEENLLQRLLGWMSVADGAFVGARDHTVEQIRKERILWKEVSAEARKIQNKHNNREKLSFALSNWAAQDPATAWAATPAPRSFWRSAGVGLAIKLKIAFIALGIVLATLWLTGSLFMWLADRSVRCCSAAGVDLFFLHAAQLLESLLGVVARLAILILGSAIFSWAFFSALPDLYEPWRKWLATINRELNRPTETWSSRVTYWSGWLVASGFGVIAWLAARYILWSDPYEPSLAQLSTPVAAILLLILLNKVFYFIGQHFPALRAWYYRPSEDAVVRAQQAHPSIEACEADLAAGTGHIISLTDLRRPYAWSAFFTLLSLRAVTFFGRIVFTDGRLGTAPGIQFGHWHIVDGGRRLLFCSNFDGSFTGYLDDFIMGPSEGTTLFWRWTELLPRRAAALGHPEVKNKRQFPPTRFLMYRGVKCELKFKSYARDSMLPHLFRYDAVNLSIEQIQRASELRSALFGARTEAKDDRILRSLES